MSHQVFRNLSSRFTGVKPIRLARFSLLIGVCLGLAACMDENTSYAVKPIHETLPAPVAAG
ncbi:acyltransferase, partial [Acidithiobacillus sp. RW2]|nr:acyltransferase [Acidithiobacillus sulfurivorans]